MNIEDRNIRFTSTVICRIFLGICCCFLAACSSQRYVYGRCFAEDAAFGR